MARDVADLAAAVSARAPRRRPWQAGVQAYTVEQVAEILHIGRDKTSDAVRCQGLAEIFCVRLRSWRWRG